MSNPGELVAIKLIDGPFRGHANAYALGFPPPLEIWAAELNNQVGISVTDSTALGGVKYRKVTQSKLPDSAAEHDNLIRGAQYEVASS